MKRAEHVRSVGGVRAVVEYEFLDPENMIPGKVYSAERDYERKVAEGLAPPAKPVKYGIRSLRKK